MLVRNLFSVFCKWISNFVFSVFCNWISSFLFKDHLFVWSFNVKFWYSSQNVDGCNIIRVSLHHLLCSICLHVVLFFFHAFLCTICIYLIFCVKGRHHSSYVVIRDKLLNFILELQFRFWGLTCCAISWSRICDSPQPPSTIFSAQDCFGISRDFEVSILVLLFFSG